MGILSDKETRNYPLKSIGKVPICSKVMEIAQLSIILPSVTNNNLEKLTERLSQRSRPLGLGHYRAVHDQPGFDNLQVMEGGCVCVCVCVFMLIECRRYSQPPPLDVDGELTGKRLSRIEDVWKKVSDVRREIESIQTTIDGVKLLECNCVLVISAFRDTTKKKGSENDTMQKFCDNNQ